MSYSLQVTEFKNENSKNAVVFLHGYGANRHDLSPLAQVIQPKDRSGQVPSYFFPDGPSTPRELAPFGGRAWFALDMQLLQLRSANPNGDLYDEAHVEKLYRATDTHVVPFLEALSKSYENIFLGGFSQGAMICADWAWRHYKPYVKALVLYSPAWPYLKAPTICTLPPKLPMFVSHGLQDNVLSIRHNELLRQKFTEKGAYIQESIFMGGHEIPKSVIIESENFLDGLLKS